jgi:hypothetical protein
MSTDTEERPATRRRRASASNGAAVPATTATCAFEVITPDDAKEMLSHNRNNRHLMPASTQRLAGVMQRGEWMADSTDAIGLDEDGGVVNGQHRLTAVVESGITITALVVRGVNPDVIKVIDMGLPRNLSQFLAMSGRYENCTELAQSLYNLWRIPTDAEKSQGTAFKPSIPQVLEFFVDHHPHLVDSVRTGIDVAKACKGIQPGWVAAYHYVMSSVDSDAADVFFTKLELGTEENGDDLDPTDPVAVLRTKIIANSEAKKKESTSTVAAWLVKAWEASQNGATLTTRSLKFNPKGVHGEDFPKVSGVSFDEDGAIVLEDEAA